MTDLPTIIAIAALIAVALLVSRLMRTHERLERKLDTLIAETVTLGAAIDRYGGDPPPTIGTAIRQAPIGDEDTQPMYPDRT